MIGEATFDDLSRVILVGERIGVMRSPGIVTDERRVYLELSFSPPETGCLLGQQPEGENSDFAVLDTTRILLNNRPELC